MNELTTEKTMTTREVGSLYVQSKGSMGALAEMTTKEVAEALGTRPNVITENAKKCLPNKKIENGKVTYWTQAEVAVLIEQLKCNQVNGRTFPNLSVELKGVERCERDSTITTMQFAKQLGTTPNVVLENARKCLPNKRIENGKPTYWTKEEVTIVLDYMKSHTSNNRSVELNSTVANTFTELTPALKLKKALELAQEAYEEELSILRAKNEAQEKQLIEQKPKVDFYDRVTESPDCIDIGQCAKILNVKNIGRNKLFEILRQKKILNERNQPYQKYVDCGYFRIIETSFNLPDGTQKINLKTVVFQKGLDFIRKMIEVAK